MSTVQISASDVNKLRQQTGAGMMDCKKALTEANGDFDAAVDYLRKKGQKVANNRSDRDAMEGVVIGKVSADKKRGVAIVLNCETDFVAKNDAFIKFVESLVDLAIEKQPADLEALKALELNGLSVTDNLFDQIGKIGEKLEISEYAVVEAPLVIVYNHPGYRLVSVVGFSSDKAEGISKDVAMQVAAMAPVAIDKDGVDQKTIDREIEVGKEQARAEGKPEEMLEKIALGKLNKFYKENTLMAQNFIKDDKVSIAQLLENTEKGLKVTEFKRLKVGS